MSKHHPRSAPDSLKMLSTTGLRICLSSVGSGNDVTPSQRTPPSQFGREQMLDATLRHDTSPLKLGKSAARFISRSRLVSSCRPNTMVSPKRLERAPFEVMRWRGE
jgi:hypothetical protein